MNHERHARLQDLFLVASELPAREREAFLERACVGDDGLRADLERLLAAHDDSASLLNGAAQDDERRVVCSRCGAGYPASRRFCEVDGELLQEDPRSLVGTTLDGLYYVEELLGRGGMGTVYRARHTLLEDVVALKLLSREVRDDPMWLARFRREGQAARRFRHPNAVAVHDLRVAGDGTVYLVQEYVEGRTLRAQLRGRSRMSARWALAVVDPIAGALDAAHEAGVVHRDVKPENIMLGTAHDGGMLVKLLDLGVAKMLEAPQGQDAPLPETRAGAMLGTPRYMSPEQWGEAQRDGRREIDGRADVYSLGVMVYEMVCGRPPYTGKEWQELRREHVSGVAMPAHECVPALLPAFGLAIARAMAKDRADRFATAGAFARALSDALASSDSHTFAVATPVDTGEPVTGEVEPLTGEMPNSTGEIDARTESNPPTNLPEQVTSFVGRERELNQVKSLIADNRFVTVTGPGGIGKTRLALRAALEMLDRFPGGVWFVDLASLADPRLVARTVVSTFEVRERSDTAPTEVLREHIGAKKLLLLLDNCEHLAAACAELASNLLVSCPGVQVLATSREVLGGTGEAIWQAPPLGEHEAVQLFAARARAQRQGFVVTERNEAAVTELCARLEGIPLAVELAAARIGVLTPAQMLSRLEGRLDLLSTRHTDVPLRHRTLRASIEWSYDLLDDAERRAFAALSVFRGGWTLDAAEAVTRSPAGVAGDPVARDRRSAAGVAGGEVSEGDAGSPATASWPGGTVVVDVLERLREASLIVTEERGDEMRYRMLETIREYASERLGEDELRVLSHRHAEYFAELTERAEPHLSKADPEWGGRLDAERANVRAVLERCWDGRIDAEAGLRIVGSLWTWWGLRAHLSEGRAAIESALAHCPGGVTKLRAKVLSAASSICIPQSDYDEARAYEEEALALWRELGDMAGVAWSLHRLSNIALAVSEYDRAAEFADESFALARDLGDGELIASTLLRRGMIAQNRGDFETAIASFEVALPLFRAQGRRQFVIATLYCLADNRLALREFDRAEELYEEALAAARAGGHAFQIAGLTQCLGDLSRYRGEYDRAEELCMEALGQFRELGAPASEALVLHILGAVSRNRGQLDRAAERLRECLTIRVDSGSRRFVADTFEEIAAVAADTGRPERAARLLGAASALREALGTPVLPVDAPAVRATAEASRAALGAEAYETAWAAGRALAFEDVVAEALA